MITSKLLKDTKYKEFNLVTWIKMVTFMELNISKLRLLHYVNHHWKISKLADFKFSKFVIRKIVKFKFQVYKNFPTVGYNGIILMCVVADSLPLLLGILLLYVGYKNNV